MERVLAMLAVPLAVACSDSHAPADGSVDADTTESCVGSGPTCHFDLGGGCCGDTVPPICTLGSWSCPSGTVLESACISAPPACGTTDHCASLAENDCIGDPECGPLYDDFCCPVCSMGGGCADCTQPQMYACGSIGAACADDPPVCGIPTGWACTGGMADCSSAHPASGGRCDVPGCVVAITAGCPDCMPVCIPVLATSCDADCTEPPPPCPPGMVADVYDGCWSRLCIPESACEPASVPGL